MKILFITVLTVTFIHDSAGCCSCKNAFNDQLTAFYKLFMKNFSLVLENRPGSQNCPPCSTFCPVDSTSECPGVGSRPSANICTKLNFEKVINAGPINTQNIPVIEHSTNIGSDGDNVVIFLEKSRELQSSFNYREYCGLYQATRKPSEEFPLYFTGYSTDISNGQVYVAGHFKFPHNLKINPRAAIFKIPINSGDDGEWTEFVLSPPLGNYYPRNIKWSNDGEKMVIIVFDNVHLAKETGGIATYVYDKHGKRIRPALSACGTGGTVGPISFDPEGNIVVIGSTSYRRHSNSINTICVYNKDTYQVKTFTPLSSSSLKCLYIHCDGTAITCDSGKTLRFMDKDYKIVRTMQTKRRYFALTVTTSDGLMRAMSSGRMDTYKLY